MDIIQQTPESVADGGEGGAEGNLRSLDLGE